MSIESIDHIQLAMPRGEEAKARAFYCGVLGMSEIEKPPALAARGGAWFVAGSVHLHLGVEEEFRPALKAHVAFRITDDTALRKNLLDAHIPCRDDNNIAGISRFFSEDCFGNRLEFISQD